MFLATPPWDLKPGETVPLKLQIRSRYGIRQLIWQGDTQILSLTPGAQANSAEGWTLIMPDWQNGERASNHWRLSVVVEDNQGQRVSSNEITLTLVLMHPYRCFHARLELHFLQHVLDVHFYCAFGDVQAAGNHLVRQTLGNQLENIALAWG